jgi:hypothetical protein
MIYQPHMEKSYWSEFTTMVQSIEGACCAYYEDLVEGACLIKWGGVEGVCLMKYRSDFGGL